MDEIVQLGEGPEKRDKWEHAAKGGQSVKKQFSALKMRGKRCEQRF